ncbi:hypothetical protein C0993_006775, partial [Termitomyces sp. T159_Od127]
MVAITPGVTFIFYYVNALAMPYVFFRFLLEFLNERGVFGRYMPPTWLVVLGSILLLPLISTIRMIYKTLHDRRRAAKLGARLVRRIDGKSIGNIDVMAALRRSRDTGYL